MDIDNSVIAVRSQQFHEGLREFLAFGPKEVYLSNTILTGKAASLASHIKGIDYIKDVMALRYLAAELGIAGLELESVIRTLEEVDFVKVVGSARNPERLDVRVPELRSSYYELGEYWKTLKPTDAEAAAIILLESVSSFPQTYDQMKSSLGLDQPLLNTILDISKDGALVDTLVKGGERVLYSPLSTEGKPDAVLALCKRHPELEIVSAFEEVRSYQGLPLNAIKGASANVLKNGLRLGVLSPYTVKYAGVEHQFAFTPRGGLQPEEMIILEKARAILAGVRCGQHFAGNGKIKYPEAIIRTLINEKKFRYPRTDIPEQYSLLITKGIARIEPDRFRSGYWHLHFIDTPENIRAANLAIDMLGSGDIQTTQITVDAKDFFDISGSCLGTLPSRARLTKAPTVSDELQSAILVELSKIQMGIVTYGRP
ncbi:hypothetical protein FBZ82_102515 [Azospirillum brasilense]|uniref:Uncharacterized protein n=1 Tax=Azospirillum brasilense TaxID=192 RepID=A0A560BJW8_AZOBR|nr:hypothetical protein [Azospirillum brasilense]TWA72913.1 hypothetical protein FBZ82_102515 [Azospirillum brasilense]